MPAGTLRDGVPTVRLEAREGEWHPDRDDGPGVVLRAFGEQGKSLQIPAPLIRVPEGTTVHAVVMNALPGVTLTVHGLHTRSASTVSMPNAVAIPPGAEREVRFVAGAPGTHFYRATTSDGRPQPIIGPSALLNGAFVIDPRDQAGPPRDRVFVVGAWGDSVGSDSARAPAGRIVMNGKSWPHTERLTASMGDTIRWRVINVTGPVHPMHLHGFYFNVTSRGDGRVDSVYAPDARHLVNTERMAPGRTGPRPSGELALSLSRQRPHPARAPARRKQTAGRAAASRREPRDGDDGWLGFALDDGRSTPTTRTSTRCASSKPDSRVR